MTDQSDFSDDEDGLSPSETNPSIVNQLYSCNGSFINLSMGKNIVDFMKSSKVIVKELPLKILDFSDEYEDDDHHEV